MFFGYTAIAMATRPPHNLLPTRVPIVERKMMGLATLWLAQAGYTRDDLDQVKDEFAILDYPDREIAIRTDIMDRAFDTGMTGFQARFSRMIDRLWAVVLGLAALATAVAAIRGFLRDR